MKESGMCKVPLQKHSSRTFYHRSCDNHVMDDVFLLKGLFSVASCNILSVDGSCVAAHLLLGHRPTSVLS